ncbi:hypothetical protein GGR08_000255 [Bartonella fuyuanensis]|uniref:Uncharacterized protein n=1 Tax=Bartonella fuyuanensis TaxID=1460968 RepID=A0A840DSE3_9HYPH|nr:hypothetical protein [Bartonella fuyuanensis]
MAGGVLVLYMGVKGIDQFKLLVFRYKQSWRVGEKYLRKGIFLLLNFSLHKYKGDGAL